LAATGRIVGSARERANFRLIRPIKIAHRLQSERDCYICAMAEPDVHKELEAFVAERDWSQFHSPSNLAKSISIEAGELLELFQWSDTADEERVREELADVLTYCHLLAYRLGAEPEELIMQKLAITRNKYPVEKSRGRSTKYTDL